MDFLFNHKTNNLTKFIPHGEVQEINFQKTNTNFYTFAFKRDKDISFSDIARALTIDFYTTNDFRACIEFVTIGTDNVEAIEESFKIVATKGHNRFSYLLPKLSGKIVEICFSIYKYQNPDLNTNIIINYLEII